MVSSDASSLTKTIIVAHQLHTLAVKSFGHLVELLLLRRRDGSGVKVVLRL